MPPLPNVGDGCSGFCVQRDQAVARRDVEDSLFSAIGPICEAAPGKPARSSLAARSFVLPVHPEHLSRPGVERNHRATRARCGVEDPIHHERCRLELVLRERAEVVGLEGPGNLKLIEIRSVNLRERRIACVPEVAAVGGPFSVLGPGLAMQKERQQAGRKQER